MTKPHAKTRALLVLSAGIPPCALLRGYIAACFWNWFVLRAVPGLPKIGVIEGLGLSIFALYLVMAESGIASTECPVAAYAAVKRSLRSSVLVLAAGALIHLLLTGV